MITPEHAAGVGEPRPPAPAASQRPWRPAPFSLRLHRPDIGEVLDFGGEPVSRAICGATVLLNEHARYGARTWHTWTRCLDCDVGTVLDSGEHA